jgi:hypothetical protein
MLARVTAPPATAPSAPRGGTWTLHLPAAPAAVRSALEAVARSEVQVLAREPSRLVLAARDADVASCVAVELRPRGAGAELVARDLGQGVSADTVKMAALAGFVLLIGVSMPADVPLRYMMFATSVPSLLYLIAAAIDARRRHRADFLRVLQAVDRAVAPLKTPDARPYRALAATRGPR